MSPNRSAIHHRNLSFELYHWKLFCYSSCLYADVKKPWLKYPACIYIISLMRGVPMLVVLFIFYFGVPYVGIQIPALLCALIGFSTVSAAYMSEIFHSSISAVDKGQWEVARSLGLTQKPIIRHIILPQALRIAVAPLAMSLSIWLRVPHWQL